MTYYVDYRLRCTNCNRYDFAERGESVREVREYAKAAGWGLVKVRNGSFWDLCPECFNRYKVDGSDALV